MRLLRRVTAVVVLVVVCALVYLPLVIGGPAPPSPFFPDLRGHPIRIITIPTSETPPVSAHRHR